MNPYGWQWTKRVQLTAGAAVLVLPITCILEKLTIWATSGARTIAATTFQLRVNGTNIGAAGSIGPGVVSGIVVQLEDGTNGSILLPAPLPANRPPTGPGERDNLVIDLSIAGTGSEEVTVYVAGIAHAGGG